MPQQPLYVQAFNQFITEPLEDKSLRLMLKQQNVESRRLSRFTQLALLGALPLQKKIQPGTVIYLGSSFSSPSKFNKMFQQLTEYDIPSPLDFMANLNNATTFQLAQLFGITAPSIFLTINSQNYWQPLQLAMLDLSLKSHTTALVGWAFEHYKPHQKEGSCWLLLSLTEENSLGILPSKFPSSQEEEFLQPLHNLMKLM